MEISLGSGNGVDENCHRYIIQELVKFNANPNPLLVNTKVCDLCRLWETIIKSPKFSDYLGYAFLQLYRATVLTVLHPDWTESVSSDWRNQLLKNIELCGDRLAHTVSNSVETCQQLIDIGNHPWGDVGVDWNNLVNGKFDYEDPGVQIYLDTESEDVILGRIHFLVSVKRRNLALCLARYLFMHVNRKRMKKSQNMQESHGLGNQTTSKWEDAAKFHCALNWLTSLLQNKTLSDLMNEVEMLACHDGIQLILNFQKKGTEKSQIIANNLIKIFLVRDIIDPKDYCCTKELLGLWCLSMKHYSMHQATSAVRDMLGHIAKNSAQFYLCADVFYSQFQATFLPLYVELFVRGLTIDINYLEVTRSEKEQSKIEQIEIHLADMFDKLSTLFSDLSDVVERECVLSAFSLRPNQERLYILQSLTHCILSDGQFKTEWEKELIQYDPGCSKYSCGQKCSNVCMQKKKLFHPLLTKGIKNIPYSLVKDLVIVLESVRCNTFHSAYFDWEKAVMEFGDYLTEYSKKSARRQLQMDYDSDTDCASDESNSPVSRANKKREYFQVSTSKSSQNFYHNGHEPDGALISTDTDCMGLNITNSSIPYVAETIEIETEGKHELIANLNEIMPNSSKLGTNGKRKEPNHHLNLPYENEQHAKIPKNYDNFFKSSAKTATVSSQVLISDISKVVNTLNSDKIAPFSEQKYSHSSTSPSTTSTLAVFKRSSQSYNLQQKETISEHYVANQKSYLIGNNNLHGASPTSFSQSSASMNISQIASNPRSSHISDVRLYNSTPKKHLMNSSLSMAINNSKQLPSTLEGLGSPYRLIPSNENPNHMLEKRKMDHHLPSADKHSSQEKLFVQDPVASKPFDKIAGKHLQNAERLPADYQVQSQNQIIQMEKIVHSEIRTSQDLKMKSGTPIGLNTHKIEFTLSNSKGTQCNHSSTSFPSPSLHHSYRPNVAKVSPIINYDHKHAANSSLVPCSEDQNKIKNQDAHGRNSVIQHTMQIQNPVTDKQVNLLPTSQISVSLPSKNEEMGIVNPLSVKVSNKKLLSGRDGYINAQLLISCPKGDKQASENQTNSGAKCETTCIPGVIYVRNKSKILNSPGTNITNSNNQLPSKTNFTSNERQGVFDNVSNKIVKKIASPNLAHTTTPLSSNQPCITEPSSDIRCDEQIRNNLYSLPANKSYSSSLPTFDVKSFNDKSVQMYNANGNSHQSIGVSQHQQINSTLPSSAYQSTSENIASKSGNYTSPKPTVLSVSEQKKMAHFAYSRQQHQKLTEPVINSKTSLRSLLSSPVAVNPAFTVSKSRVLNNTTSLNSNVSTQSSSTDTVPLPLKQEQSEPFVAKSMSMSPIYTAQCRKVVPVSVAEKQYISSNAASSASNINVQNFINYNVLPKQQNHNPTRVTAPAPSDCTVKNRNTAVVSNLRQNYASNNITSLTSTPRPFIGYNPPRFSKQQQTEATNPRKAATVSIHHVTKVPTPPIIKVPSNSCSSSTTSHTSTGSHINPSSHNMTTVPSPTPMLTSVHSNDGTPKKYWSPEPFQSPMNSTITVPTSICCSPHEVQKCQTCKRSEESHPAGTPVFDHINTPSEMSAVDSSFHDESLLSPVNPEEQIKDQNEKQNVPGKKKYKKPPPIKCDYCDKYLGTRYTLKQHIYNIHSGQNKRRKKRDSFIISDSNTSPCDSRMQPHDMENVFVKTEPLDEPKVRYNPEVTGDQNQQFESQNELGDIFDQYGPNFFANFPEQELADPQSFEKPESNIASEKSVCGPKMNENIPSIPEQPLLNPMDITKVEHTSSKPYEGNLTNSSVLPQQEKKDSNLEATAYDADTELQSPWQVAGAAMRYLSDPSYSNVDEQFFSEFQSSFDNVPEEGTSFSSGKASVPNNSYSNSSYASTPMPVSNNSPLYHKNVSTALDNFQLNDFFQDSQTSNVMENQNWQHVDPKFLPHKCATCGKNFSSEETLQVHIDSIHGNLGQIPEQSFYSYDNMFPDNLANPANLKPMPNFPTPEQQEYNASALSNTLHRTESKPESTVPPNNNFYAPTFDNQFTDMPTSSSYNTLPKSYEDSSFSSRVSDERSTVSNFMQMDNTSVLPPSDNHVCHICDSKFFSYDMKRDHMEQIHGIYLHRGRQEEINQSFDMYPGTKQKNEGNQFGDFVSKFCDNRQKDELSGYDPSLSTMLPHSKCNYLKKSPHSLIERNNPPKDEYIPNRSFVEMEPPDRITTSKKISNRSHVNSPILASVLSSPYLGNHGETIKTETIDQVDTHLDSVLTDKHPYTPKQKKATIAESGDIKFTLDLRCHMCGKKLSTPGHKKRHMRTIHKTELPSSPEDIEVFNKKPKGFRKGCKERKPKAGSKGTVNTTVYDGHVVGPHRGMKENYTTPEKNSRNHFYAMNRKPPSSIEKDLNNRNQVTPISFAERQGSPYPMPILSPVPVTTSGVGSSSAISSVPPGMPKIDALHAYKQNTMSGETAQPNNQSRYTYLDQNINTKSPVNTTMENSFSRLNHSAHSFKDSDAPPFSKMLASMAKGNHLFKKDTPNRNHLVEASQTSTIVKVPFKNSIPLDKNSESCDYGNSFVKDDAENPIIKVLGKPTVNLTKEPFISRNLSTLGESSRSVPKPYGSSPTDCLVKSTEVQSSIVKDQQLPSESQASSLNRRQPPYIVHTNPKFIPRTKLGYKNPAVKLLRLDIPTKVDLNKIKTEGHIVEMISKKTAVSPWSFLQVTKVFPPMRVKAVKDSRSAGSSKTSEVNGTKPSEEKCHKEMKNESLQKAATPEAEIENSSKASTSGENRIANVAGKCNKKSIRPTTRMRASHKNSEFEMIEPENIKKEYVEDNLTNAENIRDTKVITAEARTSLMSDDNKSSKTSCPKLFLQKVKSSDKDTKFQCYVPRKRRQKSFESSASDASLLSESISSGNMRASTRCMVKLDRLQIVEKGVTKETAKEGKRKSSANSRKKTGLKSDVPSVKTRSKRQITNKKTHSASFQRCKVLVEKVIPDQFENREMKRSPSIEEIIETPKRRRRRLERNASRPTVSRKERRRSSRLKEGSLLKKRESYLDDENTARSPIDLITIDD